MDTLEIAEVVKKHALYLQNKSGGVRANLFGANLSKANLFGANLSKANLSGANLFGATCFGANLSEANLFEANLSRANLSGANLFGANFTRPVILITAENYHMQFNFNNNELRVGGKVNSFEEWLSKDDQISINEGYSTKQCNEVRKTINFMLELYGEKQ